MDNSSFLGQGWAFPPTFDNANYSLRLSSGVANINQAIDLVLKTAMGSRSLMPDFGSNLNSFVFKQLTPSLQAEMVQSINATLLNFEPRITVEAIEVSLSDDRTVARFNVIYFIDQTNTRTNHVYPFSMLEATNLSPGI
jgi:uncharacterized protein